MKTNHVLSSVLGVNASVCENTLKKYVDKVSVCWGCEQPGHSYANRKGVILCPNKDKPGVKERAEAKHKEYRLKNAEKNKQRKKKRELSALVSTVSEQKLRTFVANEKKPKPSTVDNAIAFVSLLVCLNSMMNNKPLLPVNIDTMLPHITLPIGPKKSNPNIALTVCYEVRPYCVFDIQPFICPSPNSTLMLSRF